MAHFYKSDGTLVAKVPNASKGGLRDTTVTDAKKLGLYPSVTTVLDILRKPMLEHWKMETVAEAVLSGQATTKEEALELQESVGRNAAIRGTAIHAGIEAALSGHEDQTEHFLKRSVKPTVDKFLEWMEYTGLECESAERTAVSPELGFAGTADFVGFLNGTPCIADFKTQDFDNLKDARFYEPEYPLQLAAYRLLLDLDPNYDRISFVISRSKPGLVATKIWEDHPKADAAWRDLFSLWKYIKKWGE